MDLGEAERVLKASRAHRVLRRVPLVTEWTLGAPGGPTRAALFVDVISTGPESESDQAMAIGVIAFDYELRSGELMQVGEAIAFDDPGPVEIEELASLARQAHLVIAHDAAFVRPLAERLCPAFAELNWASSLSEIDWTGEGLAKARVDDLLQRLGWFNDESGVGAQARAGAFLLSLALPRSGVLALKALLCHARRPLTLVRAANTSFSMRQAFMDRGYRWDRRALSWWILTESPDVEIAWIEAEAKIAPRDIRAVSMPATRRYSSRREGE